MTSRLDFANVNAAALGAFPAVLSRPGEQVSTRTIERDLKFARAWLRKEIENPQTT